MNLCLIQMLIGCLIGMCIVWSFDWLFRKKPKEMKEKKIKV